MAHDIQTLPNAYDPIGSKFDVGCAGPSYPITCSDIFIQKVAPSGDGLVYGSYLGGSNAEFLGDAVIDGVGNVYLLAYYTISTDFPTTSNAIDSSLNYHDTALVKMSTNIPVYDCSGTTLSPIAQAVLAEVGSQEYCGNHYDSLINLPPGQTAFERFGDLAETADYEVDFVTMGWDPYDNERSGDNPGRLFLTGVQTLYNNVLNNPGNYPGGMRVRILLGLKKYKNSNDQRLNVLNDLDSLGIPRNVPALGWTVEVAYHDHLPSAHSHVKMMVVDGKHVITGGYNLHYNYLDPNPVHDMGIKISGPIAQDALRVFDDLWVGAHSCNLEPNEYDCTQDSPISGPIEHDPAIKIPAVTGNDVVFSLFRDYADETADKAIVAAIEAANSEVNIIQNHFANPSFWDPPEYVSAVLNALENGNASVNLLVSSGGLDLSLADQLILNMNGVCNLYHQIWDQNPLNILRFNPRFSTFDNPIHTKALSVDDTFVIVGSQGFDPSAWGLSNFNFGLAEYSLGIDSYQADNDFDEKFWAEWNDVSITVPLICLLGLLEDLEDKIDEAEPGSFVFVPPGVYTKSITINKPLVLVGAGANQTIIRPDGSEPAFRITSSGVSIMNMKISGGSGYGIELIDSSLSSLKDTQINRVVFENNAQGGVLAQGLISGSPMNYTIENNTFIGGANGVVINMAETQAETSFIRNNIFSGQSNAPIRILSTNDSRVEYSYNLFDDCEAGTCAANWRQGNMNSASSAHDNLFDLNPLFTSSANGTYQLSANSPAIDAGDPSLLHDLLQDGNNDGVLRIDIGAFEYAPVTNVAPVVNAGNDQTVELSNSITVNATYTDADNTENHSARIDWGDGTVEDVAVNMTGPGAGQVTGQHAYTSVGNYTVEVCVTDLYGAVGCDTVNIQVVSTPNACTPSNSYGSAQGAFHFTSFKQSPSTVNFDRLPLSFVPNLGQEDAVVKFQVQGLGGKLFFTSGEVVFSLPNPVKVKEDDKDKIRYDLHPANVVRIHYQGANENPEVMALDELPGVVNVLKGNDASKWRTNLPTYSGIAYRELYPGIELRYEGTDGNLKSTFHLASGANPASIVWSYKGTENVAVDNSGNLVITLPPPVKGGVGATLTEAAPIAWQDINGNRVMVAVQYAVDKNAKKVSFLLPNGYDTALPLVIDPTLSYSTYLGGGTTDEADAITLDADCNVYLTGVTYSTNFPTENPIQSNQPGSDVFVSKLNAAGNALLYSTYIGGNAGDHSWGINLDSQGRITIVGETESSDFTTQNAYQTTYAGGTCPDGAGDDVFVTQLSTDGSALRYSTYLGGNNDDEGFGLIVGPNDVIYLTGLTKSSAFPTANAFDPTFGGGTCSGAPCSDGFVAAINPALSGNASLTYSTYLGGNNNDRSNDIAVDTSGRVYVTGYTQSNDFSITPNAYQPLKASAADVFISKFDPSVSGAASLLYSTFFGGGTTDQGIGIALGGVDQVYFTGLTRSTNFPLANAFDTTFGGGTCGSSTCLDTFVTHLNIATNTLVSSSYLGGSNEEQGLGITVDDNGNTYVTGYTKSTDFTTLAAIQPGKATDSCSTPPCADAFVINVSAAGALVYSTYLGGTAEDYGNAIVVDGLGSTYIVGHTFSSNFPTTPNTFPYVGGSGSADTFVVKIND